MSSEQAKLFAQSYSDSWSKTGVMPDSYQYWRGQYLLGLVIFIWVFGFAMCCLTCCIVTYLAKKAAK